MENINVLSKGFQQRDTSWKQGLAENSSEEDVQKAFKQTLGKVNVNLLETKVSDLEKAGLSSFFRVTRVPSKRQMTSENIEFSWVIITAVLCSPFHTSFLFNLFYASFFLQVMDRVKSIVEGVPARFDVKVKEVRKSFKIASETVSLTKAMICEGLLALGLNLKGGLKPHTRDCIRVQIELIAGGKIQETFIHPLLYKVAFKHVK